jgi:hypothetical protein
MRNLFYCFLSYFVLLSCSQADLTKPVSILSTDLSLDKDPDDWFDTFLFLTTDKINPVGIILENYATDTIRYKTIEFTRILGHNNIPVLKGIQQPLKVTNGVLRSSDFEDGANFILETMAKSKGKVRLIAVGSLRNEALAYSKNPGLFLNKIEKIYFAGGTLDGSKDTNIKRDTVATRIIVDSEIPIVWIPCTNEMKQKLSGKQEERIANCSSDVCTFLTKLLADWRKFRGDEWLQKTGQLEGQGKNLWSIPIFSYIGLTDSSTLKFISGTMNFNNEKWTSYESSPDGKDIMLIELDKEEIAKWVTNKIIAYKDIRDE